MCLSSKSEVKFGSADVFYGYKVFLIDRNGLLISPFKLSKKIPFKFSESLQWKNCNVSGNSGFYSFLNCKDAENFEDTEGDGYTVHHGRFITLEVGLSNVTHFGMNATSEACLISKTIYISNYVKFRNFIHANRDSNYFKAGVEKIASMSFLEYNDYVDTFKDYDLDVHG